MRNLTNKELIEDAFKQIEKETSFHIINKQYMTTYFVFEDDNESICHFHIKEIPGFIFAFWNIKRLDTLQYQLEHNIPLWSDSLQISSKSELIFFTQYEREIDKFKPSRSGFVTGIWRDAWKESDKNDNIIDKEEWYLTDLKDILLYMKKHPIKSYIYTMSQINHIWEEISSLRCLYIFIKEARYYYVHKFLDYIKEKYILYRCKIFCRKLSTFDYILTKSDYIHPSLNLYLCRKDSINLKRYEKEVTYIDTFEDKYFSVINFNELCLYLDDKSSKTDIKKDKTLRNKFYNNLASKVKKGEKIINWEENVLFFKII